MSEQQQTLTVQQALYLAVQHHTAGRRCEAEGICNQILQTDPDQPIALHLLGIIFHQTGKDKLAVDLITKALHLKPDLPEAHNNLGVSLQYLGKVEEAVVSYQKALALKPDYAEARYNLGSALWKLGKLDEAVVSYKKALDLKLDFGQKFHDLGIALQDDDPSKQRETLVIQRILDRAIQYHKDGHLTKAESLYQQVFKIDPNALIPLHMLGVIAYQSEKYDEALELIKKALAIRPDYAEAHYDLGLVLQALSKPLGESIRSYKKALDLKPDYAEAHTNLIFTMSYLPETTGEDILREARRWNTQHGYPGAISKHKNRPDPNRRLRVGLVSGDFRNHSISYFLQTILSAINPEKLEIFAYSTVGTEDNQTAWFKSIVAKWRKVLDMSDEELAKVIIGDGIDILVDLSGHTAHNRLKMFSRKPAPIQVTWLGIGGTTGVEAIDYVLCDYLVLPPSVETHFVEKPWRLPDIWVCFSPPNIDIDVGVLPALANGHLTFGCFNNLAKMTDQTVACWALVLQAVSNSCLFLKTQQLNNDKVRQRVIAQFQDHGIGSWRLILEGGSPREELLASYQRVDIALDPFPHSGGATSLEALWMGVPFITLKGNRMQSSNGETILHNVGLQTCIAATPEAYVATAKSFASDPTRLSVLREGLRTRLLKSPVCDAPRFATNLEEAFRQMWKKWCDKTEV